MRDREVFDIELVDVRLGMTLADDVRSRAGDLLIARGNRVTPELRQRLSNYPLGHVRQPLRIILDD